MVSKKVATNLAVSYHAYLTASANNDNNGRSVWGKMLLDAQRKSGIELLKIDHLQIAIEMADEKEKEFWAPINNS